MITFLVAALPAAVAQAGPAVQFTEPDASPAAANEGHLHLRWETAAEEPLPESWHYRLEQSDNSSFERARTLYAGRDTGTYTSGLPAGSTFFRLRTEAEAGEEAGPWSPTLEIQVDFPEPWLVVTLVSVGSLLALILLGTIIRGTRNALRETG